MVHKSGGLSNTLTVHTYEGALENQQLDYGNIASPIDLQKWSYRGVSTDLRPLLGLLLFITALK